MAATATVRVSEQSHDLLRRLSEEKGISMIEALDLVLAEWEKQQFFRSLNASFAALRSDPAAWEEELEERRLWDQSLGDDVEDDDGA